MKHGFTLVEVMFANAMQLILVAGFAKITEQTFEQIQLKTLKNELGQTSEPKPNYTFVSGKNK